MTAEPAEGRGPGRPRSELVEAAILVAALDELAERGYRGLSMEAVAARAGVAKTTVYRRWSGKDDLVMQALQQMKGPIVAPAGGSVRDDLVYLVDGVRKSWMEPRQGQVMRRLAAESSSYPDLYLSFRDRLIKPRQQVILDVLARGVDEGLIRPDVELNRVLQMLVSLPIAAGVTLRKITKRDAEFLVDTVLAGLRA
ncbi:MAG TPA: TetR/AcrR family transcriptional regulator [Jatrophihabitans sp.]